MRKTLKLKLKRISTLIDSFLEIMNKVEKFVDKEEFEEAEKLVDELLERIEAKVKELKYIIPQLCNHILAFEEGVDEAWLIHLNDHKEMAKDYEEFGVKFNYCPMCGEKLNKE